MSLTMERLTDTEQNVHHRHLLTTKQMADFVAREARNTGHVSSHVYSGRQGLDSWQRRRKTIRVNGRPTQLPPSGKERMTKQLRQK